MECLFCGIVAGEIPAMRVFEDDVAIAFLDINPWQEGHALVVPKCHVADVFAAPEALTEIGGAVYETAALLRDRLGADGANILSNAGAVAGQEVFHLHVHVIPRYAASPGIGAIKGNVTASLDEVHRRIIA